MEISVYTKDMQRKDAIRRNALAGRNARVYASLCDELGIQDIEDMELYDSGQMELIEDARRVSKLEGIANRQEAGQTLPARRITKLDQETFYRLTRDVRLQKYNPSVQIPWKRDILKEAGYTHLWVGKGEKISIDDAKDSRIGSAFRDTCLNVEKNYAKA